MKKQMLKSKVLAVVVLLSVFTVSYSSNAFAWGGHDGGYGGHGGYGHYYYRGGGWHESRWFWGSLVKNKEGYTGPQGEFYQGHPTVDQLKVLYGK